MDPKEERSEEKKKRRKDRKFGRFLIYCDITGK
jgi:hypothetical protein